MKLPNDKLIKETIQKYYIERRKVCFEKKPSKYDSDRVIKYYLEKKWTYYEFEVRDNKVIKLILFVIRVTKNKKKIPELIILRFDDNFFSKNDCFKLIKRVESKNITNQKLKIYLQKGISTTLEKLSGFNVDSEYYFFPISKLRPILKRKIQKIDDIKIRKYSHERDFGHLIKIMQEDQKCGKGYYNLNILNRLEAEFNKKMWSSNKSIDIKFSLFFKNKFIGGIYGQVNGRGKARSVTIKDLFLYSKFRGKGFSIMLYKVLMEQSMKKNAKYVFATTLNLGIIKFLSKININSYARWYVQK